MKADKHPNYGRRGAEAFSYKDGAYCDDPKKYMQLYQEENREKIRKYNVGYWKTRSGKKVKRESSAKRRHGSGYTLIMPLKDSEEGHHVTDEYVIGIPADVHRHFGGRNYKKHRTKVLEWLKASDKKKYKLVLCVLSKEK